MKRNYLFCSLLIFLISTNILSAQGLSNISSFGGSQSDYPYRLIKDKAGNHFIVGFFASPTLSIGSYTLTNTGDTNAFIAKFDKNWNVLWAKSGQGNKVDYGMSCVSDNLGNCYMVGCFYSDNIKFGGYTLTNTNPGFTCDIFIVKYDPSGTVLWAKNAGGTGTDKAIDVGINNAGEIVLAGWFYSPSITIGTFNLTNSGTGTADIFIAKYTSSGSVTWARKAGGTDTDEPTSLSIDGSGNVYLTGWFSSNNIQFGGLGLVNNGGYYPRRDMFITKYNTSGTEQWAKVAGGSNQDGGCNIAVDDGGNYIYVTGSFNSDILKIGSFNLNKSLGYDFFLARFDNNGQVLWAKSSSGKGDEIGCGMAVDNRGYVYVIGGFTSLQMFIGFDTLFNKSTTDTYGKLYADIFYARYNPDGEEEWAASIGGMKNDVGTSITIEDYYKVSLAGVFVDTIQIGTGGGKLYGKGGTDIFLAEYRFINMAGTVSYNTDPITDGYAKLMRVNPGKRAPIADSVAIDEKGKYRFTDVKSGSYYIYGVADSVKFPQLVKTYYKSSPYWTSAVAVDVKATDTLVDKLDIAMMDVFTDPPGTGEINGKIVSLDGTRAAGNPIKDVEVTLMKVPPGRIMKKDYTGLDGNYSLSGLSAGNYKVMMDIPGLKLDTAYFLKIGSAATVFTNRNYTVDAKGIHIDTTKLNIFTKDKISNDLFIYPNPTNGKIFLQFNSVNPDPYDIVIYDLAGKQVIHQSSMITDINGLIGIDMLSCIKGVYILRGTSINDVFYAKIILNK
jgi:hypothetical protein